MAIAYNSAYVQTETLNITFARVGHIGGDSLAREASTFSHTRLTAYCPPSTFSTRFYSKFLTSLVNCLARSAVYHAHS